MIVIEKHITSLNQIYSEFENVLGDTFNIPAQAFLNSKYHVSDTIINNIYDDKESITNGSTHINSIYNPEMSDNTADKVIYNLDLYSDTAISSTKYNFNNYEEIVEWALWLCKKDIPTPYKNRISNTCHSIFIDGSSVFIRFPNNIGIMIILSDTGEFDLSIIFYISYNNSAYFIERSDEYLKAMNSFNWILGEKSTIFL